MKLLLAFLIGVVSATAIIRPFVHFEKPRVVQSHDTITKVAFDYTRQVFAKPGRFDAGTMNMLEQILDIDSSRIYITPDSSNTTIFYLNAWPVSDPFVMVETYAGNATGSCGNSIYVCRYSESADHWQTLLIECGGVDTVLPISHNGIFDFVIADKWDMDHSAYRFDGTGFIEMQLANPPSDELQLQQFVGDKLGIPGYPFELVISYLELGSDSVPFILVGEGMYNKFLFTRSGYGEIKFVCEFPEAVQVDFLETHHNKMPDVRIWDYPTGFIFYEWDGKIYVKIREEIWIPS